MPVYPKLGVLWCSATASEQASSADMKKEAPKYTIRDAVNLAALYDFIMNP